MNVEVEQDLVFLRRLWIGQRIGWAFMAVVIAVALLGGFGRGPLARATVGEPATLSVQLDRVTRHEARSELAVTVPPRAGRERSIVWLDARFLERFRLESVTPEPESVVLDGERVMYELAIGPAGGIVRFDGKSARNGVNEGNIGLLEDGAGEGRTARITQLVLP